MELVNIFIILFLIFFVASIIFRIAKDKSGFRREYEEILTNEEYKVKGRFE